MATATRTNKDLVQHAFDALNDRDREAFTELHADDAVVHALNEEFRDIDAIVTEEFDIFDAFSDLTYALDPILAEDELIAARWTATGTHDGEFDGIESTGKAVEFPVMGMFRIEDERVVEVWIVPDRLGLLQQLGAVELPGKHSNQGNLETVTSADGTEITFERMGSGPPLVLVHGGACDHQFWDLSGIRSAFAEQYTVYAMDCRGVGESGDATEYELEREFEDVAAVVDAIDEPVTLLGHSSGALLALEAALRTDDLHELALYEPPIPVGDHELYSEEVFAEMKQLLDAGENEQVLVLFLQEIAQSTPEEIDAQRSAPDWQDLVDAAHVWPRSVQAIGEYEFDADRFAEMATPTVLLTGNESPPFLKDATERVNDALPNSRIVTFEGHAHEAMLTAPDRFIEEVLAFIRESN